jgi:hypothetical protein
VACGTFRPALPRALGRNPRSAPPATLPPLPCLVAARGVPGQSPGGGGGGRASSSPPRGVEAWAFLVLGGATLVGGVAAWPLIGGVAALRLARARVGGGSLDRRRCERRELGSSLACWNYALEAIIKMLLL